MSASITTSWKRVWFVVAAVVLSSSATLGTLVAADLHYHHRFERIAGMNWQGYRGAVAGWKRPGERRLVVLGGSTAFGWAVLAKETFSAILERRLNEREPANGRAMVRVINLGILDVGAASFLDTLRHYAHLDYDGVILYTGYNDLGAPNRRDLRRESLLFRMTGYYPILPLVIKEKYLQLRYGSIEHGYLALREKRAAHDTPVFTPQMVALNSPEALEAAARTREALQRFPAHNLRVQADVAQPVLSQTVESQPQDAADCGPLWSFYCWALDRAIGYALEQDASILVVTQPHLSQRHIAQQEVMRRHLQQRWPSHPRLFYANLGRAVDLQDPALCFDGIHMTPSGNERVGEGLIEPVEQMLRGRVHGEGS